MASAVLLLLVADRLTKRAAVAYLAGREPFSVVGDILLFTYTENRGIAFGMFQGKASLFVVFAVIVALFCFSTYMSLPPGKRYLPLSLCLFGITAGALGNMADRLLYGYVVDFIYFKPINFPVFNVADIYITCSAFLLVFLLIFYYKDDELKI